MSKADDKWFDEHFPTKRARAAADAAVDALPVTRPMVEYIDVWLAAYKAAGGKRGPNDRD